MWFTLINKMTYLLSCLPNNKKEIVKFIPDGEYIYVGYLFLYFVPLTALLYGIYALLLILKKTELIKTLMRWSEALYMLGLSGFQGYDIKAPIIIVGALVALEFVSSIYLPQRQEVLNLILDKADPKKMKEKANALAKQFGIASLLKKYPYELSGGEQQRVAICRALINDPEVIMADEPTGNLDSISGKIVIDALEHINKDWGKTIIMVTHDPFMGSFCERALFMKDGLVFKEYQKRDSQEEFHKQLQLLE
ncbi:MAG TPA: ABC transporter ATP-binding protein [Candidatus Dorea intestinavium]|nr:ABC transporter ATP-binding protein [Candidatus Dorea intestinavium]